MYSWCLERVHALNSCRENVEGGHGHAGHAPQLLLHAQDRCPVDIQQLCTGQTCLVLKWTSTDFYSVDTVAPACLSMLCCM